MDKRTKHILDQMKPIKRAPKMRTSNGLGARLCGHLALPGIGDKYLAGYWLVILFIPIIPGGFYVVSGRGFYKFYGKVGISAIFDAFGSRAWLLILSAYVEGLLMLMALFAVFFIFAFFFAK